MMDWLLGRSAPTPQQAPPHDPTAALLAVALDNAQAVIRDLAAQVVAQSNQVAALKKLGYEAPIAVMLRPDQHEPDLPSIVADAIEQVAKPGSSLYSRLERSARRSVAGGTPADRVARRIVLGGDHDEMAVVGAEEDEDDDADRGTALYATDEDLED